MRSVPLLFLVLTGCYLSHSRPLDAAETDAATAADGGSACVAQVARPRAITGPRRAELFLWRWTGLSCVIDRYPTARSPEGRPVFPPTGCEGESCAVIFERERDCAARYAGCGAEVELPRRGPAFERAPTVDIRCGVESCAAETGCAWGVVPRCARATAGSGLACDDDLDCTGGARCCVSDNGPYPITSCRTACEARETTTCVEDDDCGPGASCCQALAHQPTVRTSVGACTPRRCDPESPIDF
jgi:hypothetical protein